MKKIIILTMFVFVITNLFSEKIVSDKEHVTGKIGNITAIESGFLIQIHDSQGNKLVPSNAEYISHEWLLVDGSSKSLMTMALYCWSNDIRVQVYCSGTTGDNSTGYGRISQIDPVE